MANLLRLGAGWVVFCISTVAFAQFDISDSQRLEEISYDTHNLRLYAQRFDNSLGYLSTSAFALNLISNYVRLIHSCLRYDVSSTQNRSIIEVVHVLENASLSISNDTRQIVSRLDLILGAITNMQSYASVPLVYTNSAALLMGYVPKPYQAELRTMYWQLTGIWPDDNTLTEFIQLYMYYGQGRDVFYNVASRLDVDSLGGDDLDAFQDLAFTYDNTFDPDRPQDSIYKIGHAYYTQYGTRPLLELMQTWTNGAPDVSAVLEQSEGGSWGVSRAIKGVLTGVSESLADTVNTNVASVATNDIVALENSDISDIWSDETGANSLLPDVENIIDSINNTGSSFVDDLENAFSPTGDFSVDVPIRTGLETGSPLRFRYSFSGMAARIRPYVQFVMSVINGLVTLYFLGMIWRCIIRAIYGTADS